MNHQPRFFLTFLSPDFFRYFLFCVLFSAVVVAVGAIAQEQDKSIEAASQSLKEAQQLCGNIDAQGKQLAKSAGYDLDKLCNSLKAIKLPDGQKSTEPLVAARKDRESKPDDKSVEQAARGKGGNNRGGDENRGVEGDNNRERLDETSQALQPFGYDLFAGEPSSFQQASHIPVSADYLLGPGDTLEVSFYHKLNESYSLEINRDGSIDFPNLGPIHLAGITFSDAKDLLQKRIRNEMIGVEASISMGELRSIQVFLLGEAYKPGSYTLSALSTITNALFLAGGVSDIASLRNVQLKRGGKLIASLDLYDLLLQGDTSQDVQLQSGDAIYIPTVDRVAAVDGAVRRPAIYELKGTVTAEQLIALAGGLQPNAFVQRARIHRVGNSGFMAVIDMDLTTAKGLRTPIKSGDRLMIDEVVEEQESVVTVLGHVHYPGKFLWRDGLRISDLISNVNALKPDADLDFALIRRETPPVGKIEPLFVDLGAVLADPDSRFNLRLFPKDTLAIFSNKKDRAELLQGFIEELRLQARSGEMARIAVINGTVRSPGEYPLTTNMTLTQLIAAAGGLNEEAYTQAVELSRHDYSNSEQVESDHFSLKLADAIRHPDQDPLLMPYDVISVRTIPEFHETLNIELKGEVKFPGVYTFKRGETLSQVVARAGGLTALAHSDAAVFTREDLREQEAERLKDLRERLRAEVAASGLEKANEGKSVDADESARIVEQLDASTALGRLVVDLSAILDGSADDVVLKDGDLLVVPEFRQEVSVVGEIQHPSAHLFDATLDIDDYLELSGGTNRRADSRHIYIVKADGSVALPKRSGWFRNRRVNIDPGDTIIVPLDVDRRRKLTVWSEVSQIVYQLALGAAAINSF